MEHSSNVLFSIGPVEITGVLVTMWVIIALLALVSWLATRNMKEVPGLLQNLAEMSVSKLQSYFEGVMGRKLAKRYFPLMATFFIFIIVCNYSGLLPGAGHITGFFRAHGQPVRNGGPGHHRVFHHPHGGTIRISIEQGFVGYLKSFLLYVYLFDHSGDVHQALSLALRLFGNLYGEEMVTEQLYGIFPIIVPLLMQVLSLLFCLIQALVFTMLLSIYISEAAGED